MTLEDRIKEAEQKFNTNREKRDNHKDQARACSDEMLRLQGEHRVLTTLLAESSIQGAAEARTIVAKPAKEKK